MKLAKTILLLTSSVFSQDNSTSTSATCFGILDCEISKVAAMPEIQSRISECATANIEVDSKSCPFLATGLSISQAQAYSKLKPYLDQCSSVTKDAKYTSCIGECTGTDKDGCVEKCKTLVEPDFVNCLAKLANQGNVDAQKVVDCTTKCSQNDITEMYNCNYSCKKSIYDSLIGGSSTSSNNNSTSASSGTNGNSSKDTKATSSTKSGSSGKSSAISSFGLNSFSAIAVATFVFALLV